MPFNRPIPDDQPRRKPSAGFNAWIEAEKLMQIAFVLPAAVAIGYGAGWWMDHLLHTKWIVIVGIVLGCISGLYYAVQTALASGRDSANGAGTENGNGKGSPGKP